MPTPISIRPEQPADVAAITEITREAFRSHPHSEQTEHFIIDALRRASALTISLVAVVDEQVVGHIAFSPVTISDGSPGWYGLGPVAVKPEFQRCGIGKALIERGLDELRRLAARGCVLVGEPEYYGRFGFRACPELTFEGVPPEYFLALFFGERAERGAVAYHEAFNARA